MKKPTAALQQAPNQDCPAVREIVRVHSLEITLRLATGGTDSFKLGTTCSSPRVAPALYSRCKAELQVSCTRRCDLTGSIEVCQNVPETFASYTRQPSGV